MSPLKLLQQQQRQQQQQQRQQQQQQRHQLLRHKVWSVNFCFHRKVFISSLTKALPFYHDNEKLEKSFFQEFETQDKESNNAFFDKAKNCFSIYHFLFCLRNISLQIFLNVTKEPIFIVQWKPLYVIRIRPGIFDFINLMISKTDGIYLIFFSKWDLWYNKPRLL